MSTTVSRLDAIAARTSQRADTADVRFAVHSPSHGIDWSWRQDGAPERYFIASVTKLFTTAIVFQQIDAGRYALDTPARDLLPAGTLDGLVAPEHVGAVTVEHLLSHTAGIPDYFEQPRADRSILAEQLVAGDTEWTQAEALDMARGAKPLGAPGAENRARYSDTDFQLLGMIIKSVDDAPYAEAVNRRITTPMGLADTYVYTQETIDRFDTIASIKYGKEPFAVPRAMAAFGPDGGIVSTAPDQIAFLKAFVGGEVFPAPMLAQATTHWRRLFFPLEYGIGLMRFSLPRLMNPFSPQPPMIGHSGATGSVLFYAPERDLYVAGTVNQFKNRALVYRVMSQLVNAAS